MLSKVYKILEQLKEEDGAGVVGHNTAESGDAIGVEGATESDEGYGLYTEDDAHVGGLLSAKQHYTDFAPNGGLSAHANHATQGQKRLPTPHFERSAENPIFSADDTNWVTTGEVGHPCIVPAEQIPDAPGDLIMYYAPHDENGAGVAYANHPEGPWTDWGQLSITNSYHGEIGAFWHEEENEVWAYVNTGNENIKLYRSPNGLDNWIDDGIVLSTNGGHAGYPKVFRTPAGVYHTTWWKYGEGRSTNILRYSPDGKSNWVTAEVSFGGSQPTGSGDPDGDFYHNGVVLLQYTDGYLGFWERQDKPSSQFDIYWGWTRDGITVGNWGVLLQGGGQSWEDAHVKDPRPIWWDGDLVLFYIGGSEGTGQIGVATADFATLKR